MNLIQTNRLAKVLDEEIPMKTFQRKSPGKEVADSFRRFMWFPAERVCAFLVHIVTNRNLGLKPASELFQMTATIETSHN